MLQLVTFASEQMRVANLKRQQLSYTPSKLNQKCGRWQVFCVELEVPLYCHSYVARTILSGPPTP